MWTIFNKSSGVGRPRGPRRGEAITTIFALIGDLGLAIQFIGVVVILGAVVVGLAPFVAALLRLGPWPTVPTIRARLGRGLVLSLEIFIAADLLRTIQTPSLNDLIVLSVITLLRVILSLSLEHEIHQLEK